MYGACEQLNVPFSEWGIWMYSLSWGMFHLDVPLGCATSAVPPGRLVDYSRTSSSVSCFACTAVCARGVCALVEQNSSGVEWLRMIRIWSFT